jgi:hypothetical protein
MARRMEKNMAELRTHHRQRKADLDRIVEEYDLVAPLANRNRENCDPELFPRETLPSNFVFSGPEIVRLVAHGRRLYRGPKARPRRPQAAKNCRPDRRRPCERSEDSQNWGKLPTGHGGQNDEALKCTCLNTRRFCFPLRLRAYAVK